MVYEGDYWWAHCSDHQRLFNWVNEEGWKFDRPDRRPRQRLRTKVAWALLNVAAWIVGATLQPQAAADRSASIVE